MKPRVLIADRHPLFWSGVETAIGSDPDITMVGQAADATDLVAKMAVRKPNVILVDTMLPGLHDDGTLDRVLSNRSSRSIVVDALANPRCAKRMIDAGAAGYLHKWCTHQELVKAVKDVHGKKVHIAPFLTGEMIREYQTAPAQPTGRELKILRLIAGGMNTKQVALQLNISVNTVKTHRAHLYEKLMVENDVQLARFAFTHGFANLTDNRAHLPATRYGKSQ